MAHVVPRLVRLGRLDLEPSALNAAYHFTNGEWGWGLLDSALAITDVFAVSSLFSSGGKLAVRVVARDGAEYVAQTGLRLASRAGGAIGEAQIFRVIQQGEKAAELLDELKGLTLTTGREYAILVLKNGTRVIVKGGEGGISFTGEIAQQIRRIIVHTPPQVTGPSDLDFQMLEILDQVSSWISEIGLPGVTKFSRL